MRRSRRDKDDPGYEEAKRAFAALGFDLDRDSVDAQARRLGLSDPHPDDPHADWDDFAAAVGLDARDPWQDDDLDPSAWSAAIPVEIASDFELDPFDLTLELEQPLGRDELDALSTVVAEAARTAGTDGDGHISWWGSGRSYRLPTGTTAATWTLDAASAGPRTIERLIDAVVRGVVTTSVPVRRIVIGQPT